MSRIAFFATMPISRITPIRLMMLSVSPVTSSAEHHADERQRQRQQDRERIEERSELHDEDEVHQHHRDAERGEDPRRTPRLLILGLAALRDRVRPAAARSSSSRASMSVDRPRQRRGPTCSPATVTTRSRSRWSICAGPTPCVIVATWPSGSVVGAPLRSRHDERQLREVGARCRATRARAARDVARLAARIDPVAGVDAGERRPQRLRDLRRR